ncbi:MAG: hypothetical protein QM784_20455 [Polyangiaceae bacterium]
MGAQACEEPEARNVFAQLAEYEPVIREAFEAIGATPWYEGESAPDAPTTKSSGCSVISTRGEHRGRALFIGIAVVAGLLVRRYLANGDIRRDFR